VLFAQLLAVPTYAKATVDDVVGAQYRDRQAESLVILSAHLFLQTLAHRVERTVWAAHICTKERPLRMHRLARTHVYNTLYPALACRFQYIPQALQVNPKGLLVIHPIPTGRACRIDRRMHYGINSLQRSIDTRIIADITIDSFPFPGDIYIVPIFPTFSRIIYRSHLVVRLHIGDNRPPQPTSGTKDSHFHKIPLSFTIDSFENIMAT
jgi:hypothetical protein